MSLPEAKRREIDAFMQRLYHESYKQRYDQGEYIDRLEVELEQRLTLNVGLVMENAELRRRLRANEQSLSTAPALSEEK